MTRAAALFVLAALPVAGCFTSSVAEYFVAPPRASCEQLTLEDYHDQPATPARLRLWYATDEGTAHQVWVEGALAEDLRYQGPLTKAALERAARQRDVRALQRRVEEHPAAPPVVGWPIDVLWTADFGAVSAVAVLRPEWLAARLSALSDERRAGVALGLASSVPDPEAHVVARDDPTWEFWRLRRAAAGPRLPAECAVYLFPRVLPLAPDDAARNVGVGLLVPVALGLDLMTAPVQILYAAFWKAVGAAGYRH